MTNKYSWRSFLTGAVDSKRIAVVVALLALYVLGIVVRIHDLPVWIETPERAFMAGEPLLKTSDGYFYLAYARDIVRDNYKEVDRRRAVPDCPPRPSPPPMLSVMTAFLSKITGLSLNWTALIVPVLAGPLLIIPMYGIGFLAGGRPCGLASALFGVTSDYFVYRSSAGWFDTDILILFLLLMVIWFFMLFGVVRRRLRYLYLAAGLLFSVLFFWWWDQAPYVVGTLCAWPLFLSLLFYYRPGKRELYLFLAGSASLFLLVLCWHGASLPMHALNALWGKFRYIAKSHGGMFPNIGLSIAEQQTLSPLEAARYTVGGVEQFLIALAGLMGLAVRNCRIILYLLPTLVTGVLSVFFAQRFLIFLSPVAALGVAFFVHELWQSGKMAYRWFALALVAIVLSGQLLQNTSEVTWPFLRPASARGMAEIASNSPSNSVVWSWWDQGYALAYWADRGTVNDGSVHGGERTVYNAIPFSTRNPRLSANFISFFTVHGMGGVRKMISMLGGGSTGLSTLLKTLGAGPDRAGKIIAGVAECDDEFLRYLFPRDLPPIYLFVDKRMMQVASWWYWFGTWNPDEMEGKRCFSQFYDNLLVSPERIVSMWGFNADLQSGTLNGLSSSYRLKEVRAILPDSRQDVSYGGTGLVLLVNAAKKFALLQSQPLSDSALSRLFVESEGWTDAAGYFELVEEKSPEYQIWKVTSDGMRW